MRAKRYRFGAVCVLLVASLAGCDDDEAAAANDGDEVTADDDGDDDVATPSDDDDDVATPSDDDDAPDSADDDDDVGPPSDDDAPDTDDDDAIDDDVGSDDDVAPEMTLCSKYGGSDNVASVVQNQVIGAIAGDCRVNTFFTSLNPEAFTRVQDCLTIQVQELFGCEGVSYSGATASNGLECRSMQDAHAGLAISDGDFDALLEDVVAGLTEAGVSSDDIGLAAPALLGMRSDIVESDDDEPTWPECRLPEADAGEADAGAPPDSDAGVAARALCDKYGGAEVVESVVRDHVIASIAGDCRVNTFFTSLDTDAFTRVQECLTIQVQELFACDGIVYAGSSASNGLPCRSMADAHLGLSISKGDFDALIEDVVAGMAEAGVEDADIAAAAPALLGMEGDIVESDEATASQTMCMASDGGATP